MQERVSITIWYHIVWSTKYRRKELTGEVAEYCRELFNEIADEFEFQTVGEQTVEPFDLLRDCRTHH